MDNRQPLARPLQLRNATGAVSALGAARTLRENHIPLGVISKNNLKDRATHIRHVAEEMLVGNKDPIDAINDAAKDANELLEDYNRRVE